jgi:ribosomal protein S1
MNKASMQGSMRVSRRKPVHLVAEGQVISGRVVNVAPFGLFIEIVPGVLDGLLRYEKTTYPDIARLYGGSDILDVIVKDVDVQRETVRLELLPDPSRYDKFWGRALEEMKAQLRGQR